MYEIPEKGNDLIKWANEFRFAEWRAPSWMTFIKPSFGDPDPNSVALLNLKTNCFEVIPLSFL
jgi:hypothetical protein